MLTFVLDASSILRYLDKEEGAVRVAQVLKDCLAGNIAAVISSIQWGEVACLLYKRHGAQSMEATLVDLLGTGIEVITATPERAVRAGIIKATRKIPYADAFAVELESDSEDRVLLTADFDAKPAQHDIRIEFLQVNPRHI